MALGNANLDPLSRVALKWSKIVAVSFDGGVVALTFGATRAMPTPSLKGSKERYQPPVRVTARLALARGAAVELANALNKLLNTLIQIQKNLPPHGSRLTKPRWRWSKRLRNKLIETPHI